MSTPSSACVPLSEDVLETIVDSQQLIPTKGVKRRLQRQRAAALLKSAAASAEEQAASSLQGQRVTEDRLRQLESELKHRKTESNSFLVSAKRYKQDKQAARATARELAAQLSEKEALVTELQFQLQDIGGRQLQASIERASAYLVDPANVFAVPATRPGT